MSKDSWLDWYEGRVIEENVAVLADVIKGARMSRILDFGCGTGRHVVYLAKMGFEVYGFDWSRAAVDLTRKELDRQGLGAKLRVWDMGDVPLPYEDAFFDAVFVIRVFHHTYTESIRRIASEIERIARRDGYLYVEVPTYEKAMRQKLEGARSEEVEPGTFVPSEGDEAGIPHHHFRKDELLQLFPNCKVLSILERHEHLCLTATRK